VAGWLAAGQPEVAVAVADVQTAGRGRSGRSWVAPTGAALLLSCGFRPTWLAPRHAWRLGAIVALAMLDAAEEVGGLREGTLGLKWPNDLVAEQVTPRGEGGDLDGGGAAPSAGRAAAHREPATLLKLAGVLGETAGSAGRIETAIVGIGVNVEWPAAAFPSQLAGSMTSLSEVGHGRPVDGDALLDAFLARLEVRHEALRDGRFDAAAWSARQRTTGRSLEVEVGDQRLAGIGEGVDPETGALLLATQEGLVRVDSGEVTRCAVMRP
jgi:BirA family biotin operon repressor/biotin-[acetyl-CoA-carboxylase] ligase